MERLIMKDIKKWFDENLKTCLLIDGARQVGKTYVVREFAKRYCKNFIEINFLDNSDARTLFKTAKNAEEILRDLDVLFPGKLVPDETLIFLDEVQECMEIVTAVKFLVEDGNYRYILSGSLLGVKYQNVKSIPVGYMQIFRMYPMNFIEFLMAYGLNDDVLKYLRKCFNDVKQPDEVIHERIMSLFRQFLIVGGMPAAVQRYLETNKFSSVKEIHEYIFDTYRADIAKYDRNKKPQIIDVYERIPDELRSQNKRFNYSSLNIPGKTNFVENTFLWLTHAGVAIPVYNVEEPKYPLRMSASRSLLKLFMNDVGLLNFAYFNDNIQFKILSDSSGVNFGAVYENFVAEELTCNGVTPYYYKSNKLGELDILAEINGKVLPLEIKSGKDYHRHNALNNVLSVRNYDIEKAYVLNCSGKIEKKDRIIYMPVYMAAFIKNNPPADMSVEKDNAPWIVHEDKI
ncbi:MAG: AAA family ATPase [Clostridia bacterium]|nr:AAA family ATPase [Clostridia bacterium]